jgi:hypothetical protein
MDYDYLIFNSSIHDSQKISKHRLFLSHEVGYMCPALIWCSTYYLSTQQVKKIKKTMISGLKLEINAFSLSRIEMNNNPNSRLKFIKSQEI